MCIKKNEVLPAVPKVVGKLEEVIQKGKLKLSATEEGQEGTNKLIASKKLLRHKFLSLCDAEGIGLTDNVEYHKTDVISPSRKLGKKERKVHMRKGIHKS